MNKYHLYSSIDCSESIVTYVSFLQFFNLHILHNFSFKKNKVNFYYKQIEKYF